jgi:hypothetical protein
LIMFIPEIFSLFADKKSSVLKIKPTKK